MCVRSGDPQKPLPAAITKGIRRFYCEASQSPIAGAAAARLAGFLNISGTTAAAFSSTVPPVTWPKATKHNSADEINRRTLPVDPNGYCDSGRNHSR